MLDTRAPSGASTTLDLPEFSRADFATGLNAVITLGAAQSVRLDANNARLLKRIKVEVVDGELRARHDGNILHALLSGALFNLSRLAYGATLHITLPVCTRVAASTGSDVQVEAGELDQFEATASTGALIAISSVKGATLRLAATSGSRVTATGACDNLEIKSSSGGSVTTIELICTDLRIDAASGSVVEATVRSSVSGHVTSGANVTLSGRPGSVDVKSASGGILQIY